MYRVLWNQAAAAYKSLYFFLFYLQFETLKSFVTLSYGTHDDSGQMYRVYRNQAAAAYLSLYFFIFLTLQFSNIKIFRRISRRNCEALKVETWYTRWQ